MSDLINVFVAIEIETTLLAVVGCPETVHSILPRNKTNDLVDVFVATEIETTPSHCGQS